MIERITVELGLIIVIGVGVFIIGGYFGDFLIDLLYPTEDSE